MYTPFWIDIVSGFCGPQPTAPRMLPTLFFYLVCLLYCLHHSGLSAQKVETCTGDCPLQVVALQNGGNRTEPSRFGTQLDLANSEWTPQQRQQASYSNSSPAQHSNGLHRIPTMAMCAMQTACQGQTAILSQLWVVVGRRLRQGLSTLHSTASEGSKLDLEFLAGKSPKTSQNPSSETIEKRLCQSQRQRRGKRQGKRKGEGKREGKGQKPRASLSLCQYSADGSACTHALSHDAELGNINHAHGGCSSWWDHFPTRRRTYCSHQESLSGRVITPTGDTGSTRQNRSCCHQRPPQGDLRFGQGAEIAQRVGRGQRKAPQSMAGPFERCAAVLATTDAILRGSAGGLQHGVKAKTDLNQSHRSIQVLNAKAAGKTPPEAAPVEPDALGPPQGEEDSEEKALRKQVHQALAQCALKVSEKLNNKEFSDLVEIRSGDEEDKRRSDAKRLRSTSPAKDGKTLMDTTAAAKASATKQ